MAEPAVYGDREVMLKDHAATMDLYKTLVDIRFKLLTFVPTVTTVAVGIVSFGRQQVTFDRGTTLVVGAAGVLASWAIVLYEVRNSQIHDRAVHRLKHLEKVLGFVPSYGAVPPQGMFHERGEGSPFLGLFRPKHDLALSMVYGIVLTLWTWVLLTGLGDFVGWFVEGDIGPGLAGKAAISVVVGLVVAAEIIRQGGTGRESPIVYTLADLIPAENSSVKSGLDRGGELWRELVCLSEFFPKEDPTVTQSKPAEQERNLSLEKFTLVVRAKNPEKLVDLAIAAGAITVEQRKWPPWNPGRGARRKQALEVKRGDDPTSVSLSQAVLGGTVVLGFVARAQLRDEGTALPHAEDIAAVQTELMDQYGANAPWCSEEEVHLRWGLLSAAQRASSCAGRSDR